MKNYKKILASLLTVSMVATFASFNVAAAIEFEAMPGGTWTFEGISEVPTDIEIYNTITDTSNISRNAESINSGALMLHAAYKSGSPNTLKKGAIFTAPTPAYDTSVVKCVINTNNKYVQRNVGLDVELSNGDKKSISLGTYNGEADYNVNYTITFNPVEGTLAINAAATKPDGSAFEGRTNAESYSGLIGSNGEKLRIENVDLWFYYTNDTRAKLYIQDVTFQEEKVTVDLGKGRVLFDEDFDDVATGAEAGLTVSSATEVTVDTDPVTTSGKALKLLPSGGKAKWVTAKIPAGATSGKYLLEFDIYDISGNTGAVQVDGSSAQFKEFSSNAYMNMGNYNNGEQIPLNANAWTKIGFLYDLDADKIHVFKDGMYITTKEATLTEITAYQFGSYGQNDDGGVWFDNIKLTMLDDFSVIGLTLSSQSSKDSTYSTDLNKGAIRGTVNAVKTALDNGYCTYAVLSAFNGKNIDTRVVYIASAYSEGRLVNTMSGVYGLATSSSKSQSFCICDLLTDDVDEIKLYVWDDLSTMVPVTESISINNEGTGGSSSGSEEPSQGGGSNDDSGDAEEDTES